MAADVRRPADAGARLAAVLQTSDAARQVTLARDLLDDLRASVLAVSQARDAAIVRLYGQGRTYQEIATLAGLTRARVAQVVQRTRRAASTAPPEHRGDPAD